MVDSNPFATRQTRPGSLPYRFANPCAEKQLDRRIEQLVGCGQIMGAHGTGKSTLIHHLVQRFRQTGLIVFHVRLSPSQHRWDGAFRRWCQSDQHAILFIDGFEQISLPSKWVIAMTARWMNRRCIVSTHQDQGFPTLWQTLADVGLSQRLADELTRRQGVDRVPPPVLRRLWIQSDGNVRELLFDLFDWYADEQALPSSSIES